MGPVDWQDGRMKLPRGAARLATLLVAAGLVAYSLFNLRFESRSVLFETRLVGQAEAGERARSGLAKLRLLTRSVGYIRSNYVSPARIRPVPMLVGALKAVEALVPEVMATPDPDDPETARAVVVRVGDQSRTFPIAGVSDLYEMNWRLLDIFEYIASYLPEDAKEDEIEYAAINGMLSPLDEHSVFLPPRAYGEMKLDTEGRFGGLGIVITTRNGVVTVVSVLPGTPADRAGLKSLDQITDIGDETTLNMLLTDAVSKLRGEPGTDVSIRVMRKGWAEPRLFTLTRAEIHIQSVTSEVLGKGVGYVRVRHFQEDTRDDLVRHLRDLRSRGALDRLVLDLRENPGGLLEQSVEVADLFVRKGTLVVTEGEGNRMRQEYRASRETPFADVPMVVLMDGGTASAAEIVAAALKGNDRAILIGDTTFGKGTVQVLYEVGNGALKLTVAQYLTPGGLSIQGVGIAPDVDLVPVSIGGERTSLGTREQRAERDPKRKLKPFGPVPNDEPRFHLPVFGTAREGDEEDADEPPIREDRFERDEVIDVAEAVVRAIRSSGRASALREAEDEVKAILARQDERIVTALREQGIDWSAGPVQPGSPVELEWRIVKGKVLVAGADARVRLVARNRSGETLYRVHVTTVSDHPALDGLEFVFGRIEAGQSVAREQRVRVSSDSWDRLDRVDFAVYQGDVEGLRPPPVTVATKGAPRPRFAYSIRLQDVAGDADGMIDPGETVDFVVEVENVGEGPARDVLLTLRNRSGEGVYVRQGRRVFKEGIAPGQSVEARFTVEVRGGADLEQVRVEVGILDQKLREYLAEERSFPVVKGPRVTFIASQQALRVRGTDSPILASASEDGPVLARVGPGFLLRALGRLGDYYRVELDTGGFAFVRAADVEPLNDVVRYPPLPALSLARSIMPALMMEPVTMGLERPVGDRLTLVGRVRFDGDDEGGGVRRKVLVFRGNDKVFFWARDGGGRGLVVPFEAVIPLEEGRNDVAVYAIEGKDRATVRRFTVYRETEVGTRDGEESAASRTGEASRGGGP